MSREGWICPVCGRGLNPDVMECPCYKITTQDSNTYRITVPPFNTGTPLPEQFTRITCESENSKNV